MATHELIERADAFLKTTDVDELNVDLQSLVASYRSRREDEDQRGAVAFARAILRRAERDGYGVEPAVRYADRKVADLQAEIDRRNEDRDEDDRIAPEGTKKADLIAALEADDQS